MAASTTTLKQLLSNYSVIQRVLTNPPSPHGHHVLRDVPIYIINLKENAERRRYIRHLFKRHGLNGRMIVVERFQYKRDEDVQAMKLEACKMGCVLSHLWCLRNALARHYERFLVLEDDVMFHKEFQTRFAQCLAEEPPGGFDLLMLGALDTNLEQHLARRTDNLYFPTQSVLGAHANLYRRSFAETFLRDKLNAPQALEFDFDYWKYMDDSSRRIAVCHPNLMVCELSSTNIYHQFSPLSASGFATFLRFCPRDFTYKHYEYMLIVFIQFVQKNEELWSAPFPQMVRAFASANGMRNMPYVADCLLHSGYTAEDMLDILRAKDIV